MYIVKTDYGCRVVGRCEMLSAKCTTKIVFYFQRYGSWYKKITLYTRVQENDMGVIPRNKGRLTGISDAKTLSRANFSTLEFRSTWTTGNANINIYVQCTIYVRKQWMYITMPFSIVVLYEYIHVRIDSKPCRFRRLKKETLILIRLLPYALTDIFEVLLLNYN